MHTDRELEARIARARKAFGEAETPFAMQTAWQRLKSLIELRSPGQVKKMERRFSR